MKYEQHTDALLVFVLKHTNWRATIRKIAIVRTEDALACRNEYVDVVGPRSTGGTQRGIALVIMLEVDLSEAVFLSEEIGDACGQVCGGALHRTCVRVIFVEVRDAWWKKATRTTTLGNQWRVIQETTVLASIRSWLSPMSIQLADEFIMQDMWASIPTMECGQPKSCATTPALKRKMVLLFPQVWRAVTAPVKCCGNPFVTNLRHALMSHAAGCQRKHGIRSVRIIRACTNCFPAVLSSFLEQ